MVKITKTRQTSTSHDDKTTKNGQIKAARSNGGQINRAPAEPGGGQRQMIEPTKNGQITADDSTFGRCPSDLSQQQGGG